LYNHTAYLIPINHKRRFVGLYPPEGGEEEEGRRRRRSSLIITRTT